MERIKFNTIHNVIIDCLNEKSYNELEIIGFWYYRFLNSDKEKLTLHLPFYSKKLSKVAFTYVRLFTILFNLLKQKNLTQFNDTCLFDIFNESPQAKMVDLTLDFLQQKDNLGLWGKDTLTKFDSFLPVFNKKELIEFNRIKTVNNTFRLFKSIRDSRIINTPQLVDLQEKILSFNNIDNLDDELISENLFQLDKRISRKEAIQTKKELNSNFNNCISIKYPYSIKPTFPLTEIGDKKFNLSFNNRFAYNEILEEDIYLLHDETKISMQLAYKIVNTKHSKDLFYLFKDFKERWNKLELNKYTTPFPKYWFLFINNSLSKEDWLIQFKKDFPAVAEKPLIKIVESIINEIIELNWIKNEITNSTRILFPELKSLRKKRLAFVFNNFKNYINTINPNVEFITTITDNNYKDALFLDSFNIIDLVNRNQKFSNSKLNIVVPDFLYFGYQPWIKYHLFNYQFTPLFNVLREELDENYFENKKEIEHLRKEIIKEIKLEYKNYRHKYKEEEIIKEVAPIEPDGNPNLEDLEFNNVEEIDNTNIEKESSYKFVIINHNLENELKLSSSEKVLLQKDTLIYVKAGSINIGDFILRNSDISKLYKADSLYDKLVNIPGSVLNYQYKLSDINNVYQILKRKGISYRGNHYFNSNYIINQEGKEYKFRIPRRKKDWSIICELLNINHSDQQLAFIAYYGRSKQNELKKMYKSIIDLLLNNNWMGTIEDPNIVTSVSSIVKRYNDIFNATKSHVINDISESIISTILDQLCFTEIRTIKTIENE